jgi:hypothetical protein
MFTRPPHRYVAGVRRSARWSRHRHAVRLRRAGGILRGRAPRHGIISARSGRVYTPSWLDVRARDGLVVLGVAVATIPFVPAYGDLPRLGAGVHIAAAFFFAAAALDRRPTRTLAEFVSAETHRDPLSIGWLYPAGLFAAIGYIFVLRSLAPTPRSKAARSPCRCSPSQSR